MDKFKPVPDIIIDVRILPYDESKVKYMRDNIKFNCNCSKCRERNSFVSKVGDLNGYQ